MKNSLLIIPALLVAAGALAVSNTDAQLNTQVDAYTEVADSGGKQGRFAARFGKRSGKHAKRHGKFKKLGINAENTEFSTEKLSNGIQKTVVISDEAALEAFHAHLDEKEIKKEGVSVEKTASGAIFTHTSDDAEKVAKMHEKADKIELKKSINKEVENISNGVRITVTSDDAEAVEKIQEKAQNNPKKEKAGVSVSMQEVSNGIVIEITSDNEEMVEKIQSRAEKRKNGKRKGGRR